MGKPCPEVSNNIKHLYVCIMLLENGGGGGVVGGFSKNLVKPWA